ncbi:MAG: hypothetical protein VX768_17950 [Planctomycetota bacterium]|nr:hypothetical protein [Planctomycetota bacterium]
MNPNGSPENTEKGKKGWFLRLAVVLAIVSILLLGLLQLVESQLDQGEKDRMTHTVARGDLTVTVSEQGTLESSNNTEIKCKIRGFNTVTWVVKVGTLVKEGDELVRLDTKVIEENVSLGKTNVNTAVATLERTKADVAKSAIALKAYQEGSFVSQDERLQESIKIAKKELATARKIQDSSRNLYTKGYVNSFELQADNFLVTQNELELKVQQTQKEVLNKYTKEMQMATLEGNLTANRSKQQSNEAGLEMDRIKLARAEAELENCIIRAPKDGLVIYPSAAEWKETPDITEGATVRKDQVLLLMPDLKKMQVKVGIHESMVDSLEVGFEAIVRIGERELRSRVSHIANVTKPAGWWTGNVVKYDTIIELPEVEGLKPGMSAEIEIIMAEHKNVVTIPVAAILETEDGKFCWVESPDGPQKRTLKLGDSNDVFVLVKEGVTEGEKVILNPLAFVDEAQKAAQRLFTDSSM